MVTFPSVSLASNDKNPWMSTFYFENDLFNGTDSHSIDKNYFVADVAGGAAISYKRLMLTWTQVMRTKEFKGQKGEHSFGSIVLSFSVPF